MRGYWDCSCAAAGMRSALSSAAALNCLGRSASENSLLKACGTGCGPEILRSNAGKMAREMWGRWCNERGRPERGRQAHITATHQVATLESNIPRRARDCERRSLHGGQGPLRPMCPKNVRPPPGPEPRSVFQSFYKEGGLGAWSPDAGTRPLAMSESRTIKAQDTIASGKKINEAADGEV